MSVTIWLPYRFPPDVFADLPVTVELCASMTDPPSDPADVEVLMPPMLQAAAAIDLLPRMTSLRVIQLMSAGADAWIGHVPEGVVLCDGRGVHNASTAEWALTAMLTWLRTFPTFIRAQAEGRWLTREEIGLAPELTGKRVLIVGAGAIGSALERRIVACEASVIRVARTARDGVHSVDDLPKLLPEADVVVLLLPLTDETRGLVDADFLAWMRDGALLVNAARGPVVATDALVTELSTGRISAALDVTDPEPLPPGHPLWSMPNVLLTPHVGGAVAGLWPRVLRLVREQLERYVSGQPLENVVTGSY
jgi:phosphoglycerate dehydrogenase-like enzyme